MADFSSEEVLRELLQAAINKDVHEKLGGMGRGLNEYNKTMSREKAKAAKLLVFQMLQKATEDFCEKMKGRIERDEESNVDNGRRMSPSQE